MTDTRGYIAAIASAFVFGLGAPAATSAPAEAAPSGPESVITDAADTRPAPGAVPQRVGKATPMTDEARAAARQRRATRSEEKDAEADRHTPTPARDASEPDHFRGQIVKVEDAAIEVQTGDGQTVHLGLSNNLTIIKLTKGSFTTVDFGSYVGSVAVRMEAYSPIVRDSLSWLHKGFELRVIDEQLRGIALGHKTWDLAQESIIAHGWVDDLEGRVLSIKYGPTEMEETDVEVPRDVPVLKMSLGDRSLINPGSHVMAGAQKGADGNYAAVYLFVGKDGVVPPL